MLRRSFLSQLAALAGLGFADLTPTDANAAIDWSEPATLDPQADVHAVADLHAWAFDIPAGATIEGIELVEYIPGEALHSRVIYRID